MACPKQGPRLYGVSRILRVSQAGNREAEFIPGLLWPRGLGQGRKCPGTAGPYVINTKE